MGLVDVKCMRAVWNPTCHPCVTESTIQRPKNGAWLCERDPLPVRAMADRHCHRRRHHSAPQSINIFSRLAMTGEEIKPECFVLQVQLFQSLNTRRPFSAACASSPSWRPRSSRSWTRWWRGHWKSWRGRPRESPFTPGFLKPDGTGRREDTTTICTMLINTCKLPELWHIRTSLNFKANGWYAFTDHWQHQRDDESK